MKNPKYIIKKADDGQFYWERSAVNGEGVAYSLPDRFTQKHTAYESIEADIRSILTILECCDISFTREGNKINVDYNSAPGWYGTSFEIEDLT